MPENPCDMGFIYCLTCDAERKQGEYEVLGPVPEHGTTKYCCKICGEAFERLPPSIVLPFEQGQQIASETEFEATAVNDGTPDYFFRLSRLVPECNVVQLKRMEVVTGNRRLVPLGIRTNTISVHDFMERVARLRLTVELTPVPDD